MLDSPDNWLTLKEASEISGKSTEQLRKMIKRGKLVRAKKISDKRGKVWVISKDEFEEGGQSVRTAVHPGQCPDNQTGQDLSVPLEIYNQQRKEWVDKYEKVLQGMMMYQFKFEELDRRMKLLPAPPEVVSYKFDELQSQAKEFEIAREEVERTRTELERITSEKEKMESSLKDLADARETVQKEKDELQAQLDESKALMEDLKNQADAKPSEADYDTFNKIRQLETFNKKLQLNLDEKAKMLEHVNKKFGTVQQAIRQAEEEKDKAIKELKNTEQEIEQASKELAQAKQEKKTLEESLENALKKAQALEEQKQKEISERLKLEEDARAKTEELARIERERLELKEALEKERRKSFFTYIKEIFFKEV